MSEEDKKMKLTSTVLLSNVIGLFVNVPNPIFVNAIYIILRWLTLAKSETKDQIFPANMN